MWGPCVAENHSDGRVAGDGLNHPPSRISNLNRQGRTSLYLYCWSGFWASHFTSQFILLAHESQSDKYVNEEIHDEEQQNKIHNMTHTPVEAYTPIHGLWTLIIITYYLVLMYV
jgi:hypothetical protein